MSVTVTETHTEHDPFSEKLTDTVHADGRGISVGNGNLYVFDGDPGGHTVAVYAPGRWVKAVRS